MTLVERRYFFVLHLPFRVIRDSPCGYLVVVTLFAELLVDKVENQNSTLNRLIQIGWIRLNYGRTEVEFGGFLSQTKFVAGDEIRHSFGFVDGHYLNDRFVNSIRFRCEQKKARLLLIGCVAA